MKKKKLTYLSENPVLISLTLFNESPLAQCFSKSASPHIRKNCFCFKAFISYTIQTLKMERNSQVYTHSERPDLPETVGSFI